VLGAIAVGLVLTGCATTHLARPVGQGNTRVNLSLGGPMVKLGGTPIPIPLTTVGVAHGMSDALDVHADLHPFVALFSPGEDINGNRSAPVLGADLGLAWHPIERHRTALTVGGALYGFSNRADAIVFGDLWIGTGVYATRWLWLSAGLHNQLRIAASDRELRERPLWAPTAYAQVGFVLGRVQLDLEGRWYSFTQNGHRTAPDYFPIGELGALGVLFGVSYQFDGGNQ
jgi:hypothetical protein